MTQQPAAAVAPQAGASPATAAAQARDTGPAAAAIEGGDPAADARAFRRCLGQFTTGVTVVTTAVDGVRAGVTANSYNALSLDPPLVLWSIGRTSRSHDIFARAGRFAIHILGDDQIEVSRHFSGPADDKFAGRDWQAGLGGVPLVPGAIAVLECATHAAQPAGDHLLMIGRVERFARHPGRPLLYLQGAYGVGDAHPQTQPPADGAPAPVLLHRLAHAWHLLSSGFAGERAAEGLTAAQGQLLGALARAAGPVAAGSVPMLACLPAGSAADALAELTGRGLVGTGPEGISLSPAGRACHDRIEGRWRLFEAERLSRLPPAAAANLYTALEGLIAAGSAPGPNEGRT